MGEPKWGAILKPLKIKNFPKTNKNKLGLQSIYNKKFFPLTPPKFFARHVGKFFCLKA